jgi:hypothetical protein
MSVTLELSPDLEEQMIVAAKAQGLSLENYLVSLIRGGASLSAYSPGTPEDFERDWEALSQFSEEIPVLSDESYSRESIYDGS